MLKIGDIVDAMDGVFPLSTQEDWDNSGLLVGSREWTLRGLLLTVDITEERVEEAIDKGCNMILSHHPIMFRGLRRLNGCNDEERTVMLAVKNDVALCAFHTPADKSLLGTSGTLGRMIGLEKIKTLALEKCDEGGEARGYGVVGELKQPMCADEFMQTIKDRLGCQCIRHSDYDGKVRRVAICTGSGSEFIGLAKREKADAYVTADVKYHQFQQGDGMMMIVDVGHYESEELCKKLFFEILKEKMPTFAPCISDTCKNIIKYY